MPLPTLSLAVVGADFPNKRGPGRRFELQMCSPGELVHLIPEPKNPADPRAIAVFSARGVQIGYLTAERAPRIGSIIASGCEVQAVFQRHASFGAWIRVAFEGEEPTLPAASDSKEEQQNDPDFWPDYIPPDD